MPHQVFDARNVAVVTGGASGIGLAAARRFQQFGMRVAIADLPGERLTRAERELGQSGVVLAVPTDVSDPASLRHLEATVVEKLGPINLLMNNAGIGISSDVLGPAASWSRILETNLMGVVHGSQIMVPAMLAHGQPAIVINTGSKQGITTPPGNPAYNVAKAGVKAFTEALQHHLRNIPDGRVTAHLLIPGFVFTGMTGGHHTSKPDAAWTAEQTVDFMISSIEKGDFYILCPDNAVPRTLDERRILWAAGDLVENRPPLSRWHTEYTAAFEAFCAEG